MREIRKRAGFMRCMGGYVGTRKLVGKKKKKKDACSAIAFNRVFF